MSQALSYLLSSAQDRRLLHGIKLARAASVLTNILFANGTLLLAQATRAEANNLLSLVQSYTTAFSQFVNY